MLQWYCIKVQQRPAAVKTNSAWHSRLWQSSQRAAKACAWHFSPRPRGYGLRREGGMCVFWIMKASPALRPAHFWLHQKMSKKNDVAMVTVRIASASESRKGCSDSAASACTPTLPGNASCSTWTQTEWRKCDNETAKWLAHWALGAAKLSASVRIGCEKRMALNRCRFLDCCSFFQFCWANCAPLVQLGVS